MGMDEPSTRAARAMALVVAQVSRDRLLSFFWPISPTKSRPSWGIGQRRNVFVRLRCFALSRSCLVLIAASLALACISSSSACVSLPTFNGPTSATCFASRRLCGSSSPFRSLWLVGPRCTAAGGERCALSGSIS